jgi:O-antigen/teichoic acid export membrane protein
MKLLDPLRRAPWLVLDQGLSSISNFLLSIILVRSVPVREFGAFAVAWSMYSGILSLARTQTSDPLVIRYSTVGEQEWKEATGAATGFALVLGIVAGAAILAVAAMVKGPLAAAMTPVGIFLPALLVQDAWRYAFFAKATPSRAALNDLAWVVAQGVLFVSVAVADGVGVSSMTLAWGAAATVAAIAGGFQAGIVPSPSRAAAWFHQQRGLGSPLSGSFVMREGTAQLALLSIGWFAGLAAVGTVRAALLMFGPLQVVLLSAIPFAVSEGARLLQESPGRVFSVARIFSAFLGICTLVWGGLLILLPNHAGVVLLGEAWARARVLFPVLTICLLANAIDIGAEAGLRALGAVKRILHARMLVAPLSIGLAALGAWRAGARGAAVGLATANVVFAFILWLQFRAAAVTWQGLPREVVGTDPELGVG